MVIKKLHIENFLCYYDKSTFELSDGLNIILGENGEGKTKFFEAIEWLFNEESDDLDKLVSAKRFSETENDQSFQVKVSMTVVQYGEKHIITKSFTATKVGPNECSISNSMIQGITEKSNGEREQVDGESLLDQIFPYQIRRYSMFKGESELNIFENENALINLINHFSEAKYYDKYPIKGEFLRKNAEKAVQDSTKLNNKNKQRYEKLEYEIEKLERDKDRYQALFDSTLEEIEILENNLEEVKRHVSNAEALQTIENRIRNFQNEISKRNRVLNENYTTSLFDENWILVNFEPFHKEFAQKVSQHSIERRKLQTEFDKEKGIKEGEKKAAKELLNNAIPLPINVPSKSIMQEMLADKLCKVCGRKASLDGTDEEIKAYKYLYERLENYLNSQKVQEEDVTDDEQLFKYEFTKRLENLSLTHEDRLKDLRLIRTSISELFELNKKRRSQIVLNEGYIQQAKNERDKILGKSSLAEESLSSVLTNYNTWSEDLIDKSNWKTDYSLELESITEKLAKKNQEKDNIDMESANSFLISTRDILRDIEKIFVETKGKKFDDFIAKLETKSNHFLKTINVDAFTGTIAFSRRTKMNRTTIKVELRESGRPYPKPNQSLETSMHISILFAISELALEVREENYPMIFDAPTSSFGENKTSKFLDLIYQTDNQKILLIKDFLHTDEVTNTLAIKKEFEAVRRDKAFWVKLERPFHPNDLTTINSKVISL